MNDLSLDLFTKVGLDSEIRQYHILDGLKKIRDKFSFNKLYPHLSEVISLYQTLSIINREVKKLEDGMPSQIKDINFIDQKITYQLLHNDHKHLDSVKKTINWALPLIKETIDEGIAIYEFVDENILVEKIGIMPNYTEEGYIFVPDNKGKKLYLFRYELTIYTKSDDNYRSLKTKYISTMDESLLKSSLNSVKLQLLKKHDDLPNPATYAFSTDLDFSFEDTMFPVIKRKFLKYLSK
jgi:hypothetical protein